MKKSLLILGVLACLQGLNSAPCAAEVDSNDLIQANGICIDPIPCRDAKYIFYPTRNNYTFLRLDSSDGSVHLFQWSFEYNKRFHYELYSSPLYSSETPQIGRFQLLPTANIYVFLRVDRINGTVDMLEWKSRTIHTIYETNKENITRK